jgi:magnesium-transporting ATPase (P-type)
MENIFPQIGSLVVSAVPVSIILIALLNRLFYKQNPDIAKTSIICTDLVGPLTKNILYPKTLIIDKDFIKIKHDKNLVEIINTDTKESIKVEKTYLRQNESAQLAAIAANICGYEKQKDKEEIIKNFFLECGFNKIKISSEYDRIQEIPSNNEKKISSTVVIKNDTREIFTFTKGNPYKVLEKCSRILLNGKKQELTAALKAKIKKDIKRLNMDGQKVFGFAYKGLPLKRLHHYTESFTESDLVFIGIISLAYPINTDLKDSIAWTKNNGIRIYITTVHQDKKAVSTAINLGIINPHYFETITGGDIEINEKKLSKTLSNKEKDFVFAELKREDKLKIIKALQESGETVAVASKRTNSSLNSIVEEIKKQRANILHSRKFLYHGFAFTIATFLLNLTAFAINTPLPISINVVLILNVLVNLLIELSLRKDPLPQTRDRKFTLTTPKININRLITMSAGIYFITTAIYFFTLMRYGWTFGENMLSNTEVVAKTTSIIFVLLVFIQVLNGFNLRFNKKTLFRLNTLSNPYLVLTAVISLLGLMLISTSMEFKKIMGFISLSGLEIETVMMASIGIVFVEEIRKYLVRRLSKK